MSYFLLETNGVGFILKIAFTNELSHKNFSKNVIVNLVASLIYKHSFYNKIIDLSNF